MFNNRGLSSTTCGVSDKSRARPAGPVGLTGEREELPDAVRFVVTGVEVSLEISL